MRHCFICAEVGINHNGSEDIAKQLIDVAAAAGCDAVKFQIRDVNGCYDPDRLIEFKDSPWGITYGDYARGRELSADTHALLKEYAHDCGLQWGFSVWDVLGAKRSRALEPDFVKVPSAKACNAKFVGKVAEWYKDIPVQFSTAGMEWPSIDEALMACEAACARKILIYQCVAAYPCEPVHANIRAVLAMRMRYGNRAMVGYSSHCTGPLIPTSAVLMGADAIEVHITLDRAMWGSDQAASLERKALEQMVRDVRILESGGIGTGNKLLTEYERAKIADLKRGLK